MAAKAWRGQKEKKSAFVRREPRTSEAPSSVMLGDASTSSLAPMGSFFSPSTPACAARRGLWRRERRQEAGTGSKDLQRGGGAARCAPRARLVGVEGPVHVREDDGRRAEPAWGRGRCSGMMQAARRPIWLARERQGRPEQARAALRTRSRRAPRPRSSTMTRAALRSRRTRQPCRSRRRARERSRPRWTRGAARRGRSCRGGSGRSGGGSWLPAARKRWNDRSSEAHRVVSPRRDWTARRAAPSACSAPMGARASPLAFSPSGEAWERVKRRKATSSASRTRRSSRMGPCARPAALRIRLDPQSRSL